MQVKLKTSGSRQVMVSIPVHNNKMTLTIQTFAWDDFRTERKFITESEVLKLLGKGRLTKRRGEWIAHHKEPGLRQPGKISRSMVQAMFIQGLISISEKTRIWATLTASGAEVLRDVLIDEAAEKFAGVDR